MRPIRSIAATLALIVVLAGCGKPNSYGSNDPGELVAGPTSACRLGEKCESPSPSPEPSGANALGQQSPTPPPTKPTAQEQYFDVTLIADSPFYEPGNALTMPVGWVLRVTNKDNSEGKPQRSFTASDGSFDSGPLKPGQTWTRKFDGPGNWEIKDIGAPFIYATLEVK